MMAFWDTVYKSLTKVKRKLMEAASRTSVVPLIHETYNSIDRRGSGSLVLVSSVSPSHQFINVAIQLGLAHISSFNRSTEARQELPLSFDSASSETKSACTISGSKIPFLVPISFSG